MAFLETKKAVASYMGHPSGSQTKYVPADFIVNSTDLLALAINNARRVFETLWDFNWSQVDALLTIAASGGLLSAATLNPTGSISIKRVQAVLVPISGTDFIPVEFLDDQANLDRIRAQVGRQRYNSSATLDDLGISSEFPYAVQQGQIITLNPAEQFSFPVSAKLNVVKFLSDYSADADTDFILTIAPQAIMYQSIVELNRLTKNFSVRPSEGDVSDTMDLAQMAFEGLVKWDISLRQGTNTASPEIPQLPRPPQGKPA
jgi:hypothetical protein